MQSSEYNLKRSQLAREGWRKIPVARRKAIGLKHWQNLPESTKRKQISALKSYRGGWAKATPKQRQRKIESMKRSLRAYWTNLSAEERTRKAGWEIPDPKKRQERIESTRRGVINYWSKLTAGERRAKMARLHEAAGDYFARKRTGWSFYRIPIRGKEIGFEARQMVRVQRPTQLTRLLARELEETVQQALNSLPANQRTVLTLRLFEESFVSEIAKATNLREQQVLQEYENAIKALSENKLLTELLKPR